MHYDVIVAEAVQPGIAAARRFHDAGKRVIVLEAGVPPMNTALGV